MYKETKGEDVLVTIDMGNFKTSVKRERDVHRYLIYHKEVDLSHSLNYKSSK